MELNECIGIIKRGESEIIGKDEKLKEFAESLWTAIGAIRELQQYQAIGTVEECREAMERKQKKQGINISKKERGLRLQFCTCPTCGKRISNVEGGNYCQNCGQALLWEGKE